MRALIVAVVAACAHREAPPPAPPPAPSPPPADAAVVSFADALQIPTATGDWDKHEIEAERMPPAPDAPPSPVLAAIRARKAAMQRCWKDRTLLAVDPPTVVAVNLSVGRDGTVTKVHVTGVDPLIAPCLEHALAAMHLPPGPDAYVLRYPFNE